MKIIDDSNGPSVAAVDVKSFVVDSRSNGSTAVYYYSAEEFSGSVTVSGDSNGAGSDFGDVWEFSGLATMIWNYLQVQNE